MMPEQQQRILGYFIEEAKDHLNTIEQGLLSLQKTIEDTEIINEVFRAAHSIKGGAAMLGIESVQHTSHRLEDYFKVLKESPIQTDRTLESMFLQVFDGLQSLVEELQGPFGLTEDKAQEVMGDIEPVFEQLEKHLDSLVAQAEKSGVVASTAPVATPAKPSTAPAAHTEESALRLVFRSDVPGHLRDMLRLFKQPDNAESRTALQHSCDALLRIGEQFDLTHWCALLRLAGQAVGNQEQTYRALAPVVIKDVKQAQEWVLGGRATEITPSNAMQALLPPPAIEPAFDATEGELDALLNDALSEPDSPDLADLFTESHATAASDDDLDELFDVNALTADTADAAATDELGDLFAEDALAVEQSEPATRGDLFDEDSLTEGSANPLLNVESDLGDLFQSDSPQSTAALDLEENDDWLMGGGESAPTSEVGRLTDAVSAVDAFANISDESSTDDGLLTPPQGPEVGAAELNSLADLFEGEMADAPWQEESNTDRESSTDESSLDIDISNEFSDLLLSESDNNEVVNSGGNSSQEELTNLFGDIAFDDEEPLGDEIATDLNVSVDGGTSAPEDLDNLFDDVDLDEGQGQEAEITADLNLDVDSSESATADLGDLFGDAALDEDLEADGTLSADLDLEINESASAPDDLDQLFDGVAHHEAADTQLEPITADTSLGMAAPETALEVFDELFDDANSHENAGGKPTLETADFDGLFSPSPVIETIEPESFVDLALSGDEGLNEESLASETDDDLDGLFDLPPAGEDVFTMPHDDVSELALGVVGEEEPIAVDPPFEIDLSFDSNPDNALGIEADNNLDEKTISSVGLDTPAPEADDAANLDMDLDFLGEPTDQGSSTPVPTSSEPVEDVDDLFAIPSVSEAVGSGLADASVDPLEGGEGLDDPWSEMELESQVVAQSRPEAIATSLDALDDPWGSTDNHGSESDDPALDALDSLWDVTSEHATTAIDEPDVEENADSNDNAADSTESLSLFGDSEAEAELFQDVDLPADLGDPSLEVSSDLDMDVPDLSLGDSLFGETDGENSDLENLNALVETDPVFEVEALAADVVFPEASDDLEDDNTSLGELDALLDDDLDDDNTGLGELDALLSEDASLTAASAAIADLESPGFDDLDALLGNEDESEAAVEDGLLAAEDDFEGLDALLDDDVALEPDSLSPETADDFGDLEKLLEQADQALGGGGSPTIRPGSTGRSSRRAASIGDQTMRVSVKHLDTLSNLVGELVVNRNSLEQDQERLRQFLDNLLFQVQQLNDVGQRMRDLYERSLLESSLISSRQAFHTGGTAAAVSGNGEGSGDNHATGATFDALEMDRFTGFHTLSQEMIELIVRVRESASDIGYTVESSDRITRQFRQVTTQLQEGLNKARMVPFAQTADRLPRAVRDISLKCGKEARLVVEGRDTLIDKMILERLYDPMTHLVNNAITHGIETPDERSAAGKSREGTITVKAFYQGNQTVIYIADDGGGINPDVVKQKAIKKGLMTQAEARAMSVIETYELLFRPGFSTRDQADDFAGRGVGMDVVRTALSEIRGNITIDSEMGKGTSFTIRLPLTLSISKALSCLNNQARIAFPMDGVEDMFDVPKERIQTDENGHNSILWRDTILPFQALSDLLQFNRTLGRGRVYGGSQDEDIVSIVVLRSANAHIGLQVDRVLGEQEIVIKQLEGPVPKPIGIAGATVLGDGRVMPIADVLELIDISQGRVRRDSSAPLWSQDDNAPVETTLPPKAEPTVLIVDDSITVRELLSMSFNKVGYRVEQARDGQEAWEKLRSGLPCDLVFCDIEMPRMDGLELLSRLQKDGTLKSMPIAMLTSRGADRHRQMAVDLGASGYFTKPYLEEALLDAAQRMLNGEVLLHGPGSAEN